MPFNFTSLKGLSGVANRLPAGCLQMVMEYIENVDVSNRKVRKGWYRRI